MNQLVAGSVLFFFAALMLPCGHGASATPESLDQLVRDLSFKSPWYYRAVDENLGTNRSRLPPRIVKRAIEEDTAAALKRRDAAARIKELGKDAWPAVPALIDELREENLSRRVVAADVLAGIRAEQSPMWSTNVQRIANGVRAVEAIRRLLTDKHDFSRPYDATHRRFALVALGDLGAAARIATNEVVAVLKARDAHELWPLAVTTLVKTGADTRPLLPALQSTLRNAEEWPAVSASAAMALARVTPLAQETVLALTEAMRDSRSLVRVRSAEALWAIGRSVDNVLPVLIDATRHPLASVRLASLGALAQMGTSALPAESAVRALVADRDEAVRKTATATLEKVSGSRH